MNRGYKLPHFFQSNISVGTSVVASGIIDEYAERFDINLINKLDHEKNEGVILHVKFLFKEKSILNSNNAMILNTNLYGVWGKEETHSHSLKKGEKFNVRIISYENRYEIFVNYKHIADFKHRISALKVDNVEIKGNIILEEAYSGGQLNEIPFENSFPNGQLRIGQRLSIFGVPTGNFFINFLDQTGEILFHFNPRFNEKKVVRNSCTNGLWENEEREGSFPFVKKTGFSIKFINEIYGIQVFINDTRYCNFAHRKNAENYNRLQIKGEVKIYEIDIINIK